MSIIPATSTILIYPMCSVLIVLSQFWPGHVLCSLIGWTLAGLPGCGEATHVLAPFTVLSIQLLSSFC